jgi:outer membrane protein assembly factor BamB
MLASFAFAGFAGLKLAAQETSTDWPQFRGPGGLGVGTGPVTGSWGKEKNVIWRSALPGAGSSSPIVSRGKVFVTCYRGYNVPGKDGGSMEQLRLHVVCLDRVSGKILWNKELTPRLPEQATIREEHGYASATPAADGERVYVFFGRSGVYAFDFDGKQQWHADVGDGVHGWGSAASPVLFGDLVIVNASVESESLVALDKRSGQEVWRVKGISEAWNTPLLVATQGGNHELVVGVPRNVLGFDPATGKALWSCDTDIEWYIVPSMVTREGVVWSIGGRSGVAAVAVCAGGRGDVTKTHRLWTSRKGGNVSSPVVHDGYLYWMHDNMGIAYCAEAATGKIVYEKRVERVDQVYASPVLADGKLYYVSRSGRTFVLAAEPKYQLLAVNDLEDAGIFNASPAVSGNRLFLRSNQFLYCIGDR